MKVSKPITKKRGRITSSKWRFKDYCSADSGAIAELEVCAKLLRKGFEVYRSVSPASSCDLIAFNKKKNELFRVEVRTGKIRKDGEITYPTSNCDKYDIMAVFIKKSEFNSKVKNKIVFIPELR